MKTLIATSIIALSSSAAMAESFAYERQFGTPELFPALVLEQSMTSAPFGGSPSFAYERAIDVPELFPTLVAEKHMGQALIGKAVVDTAQDHDSIWGWNFPIGG